MTSGDVFSLVFTLLGGLALFIVGMNLTTDGLRQAAGSRLRAVLGSATRSRFSGIAMGTLLGSLIQSGAATLMLASFINAGLMTLLESIPPLIGANIGTTISMQLISFRIGDYAYVAIATGFILQFLSPRSMLRNVGTAVLGFGLIFLGMNTMSAAISPHSELFINALASSQGGSLKNRMIAFGVGILAAAAIHSGPVIGTCFALIQAGVFQGLEQVFPIVLGAHIGTCVTTLLASIGANIEARRSACSHLLFNVITSGLALALAPVFLKLIPMTSGDLLRQTANMHTAVMLFGALLILPVTPLFARFVARVIPSKKPLPPRSFLDPGLVKYPEKAIYAAIAELQRVTKICAYSFRLTIDILFQVQRRQVQEVKLNENVVNEIKKAMKDYLNTLTHRHLSRRQAIMIQHLNRCMADIERIGDHIDEVCDISLRRSRSREARFNRETLELLFSLYESAHRILHLVIQSLNPENQDFQGMAQAILAARDEYVEKSINTKAAFTQHIVNHDFPPIVGIFFSEYTAAFDRIVKHAKTIALAEKQPYFWIKRKKLERMAGEAQGYTPPPPTNAQDFLDRLHADEYL